VTSVDNNAKTSLHPTTLQLCIMAPTNAVKASSLIRRSLLYFNTIDISLRALFAARRYAAWRGICCGRVFVCPFLRLLSVSSRYYVKIAKRRITISDNISETVQDRNMVVMVLMED